MKTTTNDAIQFVKQLIEMEWLSIALCLYLFCFLSLCRY